MNRALNFSDERRVYAARVMERRQTMFAIAYAILRNPHDAMDAVQDAILQGWLKRGALRDETRFAAWMTRILVNTCKNALRRRRPTAELFDISDAPGHSEDALDIRAAMARLDVKLRICATLFYYEDMSLRDIAATLGLSQGTVKSRLHRARARLRSDLEVRD